MNASSSRNQTIFYTAAFIIISILALIIFAPYLTVFALAVILAVLAQPAYVRILKLVKFPTLASILTILLIIVVIGIPITLVGNQLIREAQNLYVNVSSGASFSVDDLTARIEGFARQYDPDFTFNAREYLAVFSSWVVSHLGGFFSGTLDFGIKFFLCLISLFYFLRDGEFFRKQIVALSPLSDEKDKVLTDSIKSAIHSVIVGSLVVASVQGLLSGIGFSIFGLPNATLWGTVAAVAALVPSLGTGLVAVPAVIYLYFYGPEFAWLGQALWSMVLVGLVDNFLGPIVINKGINIHPFIILFSILGGIQFFGPEGVLLGPLVISLLFALVRLNHKDLDKGDVHKGSAPAALQ